MRLEILPFVFLKHFKVWAANSTLADKRAIWDHQFWASFGSRTCSQLNVLKHPVKHPVKHPETMWVCPIKGLSVYHHFPRFLHGHKLGYPWIFLIAGQHRSVFELFLIMSLQNGWYINIWDIGRLWPYSLFLRFEVKKIGSQVTKCAWSPTPVTQKWCVPFVVACDPIRARSIIFEGSLAEKLRFWVSQLHFWRKSRRKASF